MEIKITTAQSLKILEIISWIIFIGLCIETGGLLFNTGYTFFYNAINVHRFWEDIDFSSLYNFDKGHFFVIILFMIIISAMKTVIFYLIIKMLQNKNLNFTKPFNHNLPKLISNIGILSLSIGLFSKFGIKYYNWLVSQKVSMPSIQNLEIDGFSVWIFMGIVLLVILKIFKRGIEIQSENDLTI